MINLFGNLGNFQPFSIFFVCLFVCFFFFFLWDKIFNDVPQNFGFSKHTNQFGMIGVIHWYLYDDTHWKQGHKCLSPKNTKHVLILHVTCARQKEKKRVKERDILYLIFQQILVLGANYSSSTPTVVFHPYLDEPKSSVPPLCSTLCSTN